MKASLRWPLFCLALICLAITVAFAGLDVLISGIPPEHPAIEYFKTHPDDAVTRLGKRLDKGEAKLDYVPGRLGYLPSLLKNLNVNIDSQMLVFSKTSFQAPLISPRSPRAVFFNDTVSVGSVKGGEVLELAALDPKLGVVFYTLNVEKSTHPIFVRRDVCLQCHQVQATLGVPGIEVGSSYPKPDGTPNFQAGYTAVDHRIPLEQRWGGWFVSGKTGNVTNLGNAVVPDPAYPNELDTTDSHNLTNLAGKVNLDGYAAQSSDIVALMVLEHQTRMTNLIVRVAWETRVCRARWQTCRGDAEYSIQRSMNLVAYMLFAEETLAEGTGRGNCLTTFTENFSAARRPREQAGAFFAGFRSEDPDVQIPDELHDLYGSVRRHSGLGAGPDLSAALRCTHRQEQERTVCEDFDDGSAGGTQEIPCATPRADAAGLLEVVLEVAARSILCRRLFHAIHNNQIERLFRRDEDFKPSWS